MRPAGCRWSSQRSSPSARGPRLPRGITWSRTSRSCLARRRPRPQRPRARQTHLRRRPPQLAQPEPLGSKPQALRLLGPLVQPPPVGPQPWRPLVQLMRRQPQPPSQAREGRQPPATHSAPRPASRLVGRRRKLRSLGLQSQGSHWLHRPPSWTWPCGTHSSPGTKAQGFPFRVLQQPPFPLQSMAGGHPELQWTPSPTRRIRAHRQTQPPAAPEDLERSGRQQLQRKGRGRRARRG
mmetsp:Transcript_44921/g.128300  ORF Transcript_44921/g.128300 Transcript_44921/m.128300 type:complete len:237 (-) Transcript_44921:764-1474(-)